MMEQNSIDNLAYLNTSLVILEKSAKSEEARITLQVCQLMIGKIVVNEDIEKEFRDSIRKVVSSYNSSIDKLENMSEKNRNLIIQHGWEDVKRRIE